MTVRQRADLTFKANLADTRYGWLRLTPAYGINLVADLVARHCEREHVVLDPFCGTGTTALVCAERGIACDTTDINPFLVWLAAVKARAYDDNDLATFVSRTGVIAREIETPTGRDAWTPPLHQVEKWWGARTMNALGHAMAGIKRENPDSPAADLLRVVFCRSMIDHANVSFGHQSMSFKARDERALSSMAEHWRRSSAAVVDAARRSPSVQPRVMTCDARNLRMCLSDDQYDCVITSPPYPNRMSYVRELRPYMYWLGYLADGRAAGELDWQAIGGTWGCASSNVSKWIVPEGVTVPFDGFDNIIASIAARSALLSNYVRKYFCDMVEHCNGLFSVVKHGGTVHYVVGNSKFYDTMLPVEAIYAAMFGAAGFVDVSVKTIRKRSSKRELFEFIVSARKP